MPSCSATRRASSTSATEQQPESEAPPHSLRVAPTTVVAELLDQQRGGHRGVDPAGHGHQHPHRSQSRRRATASGHDREGTVDVVIGRGPTRGRTGCPSGPRSGRTPMAASTWLGSTAPLEQAAPADAAHPGLVEQDDQRLALDPGRYGGGGCPATRSAAGAGLDRAGHGAAAGRRPAGRAARPTRGRPSAGRSATVAPARRPCPPRRRRPGSRSAARAPVPRRASGRAARCPCRDDQRADPLRARRTCGR